MLGWPVSQCTCRMMQWFNLFLVTVSLKKVLLSFFAKNDRSCVVLNAGLTRSNNANLSTSATKCFCQLLFPKSLKTSIIFPPQTKMNQFYFNLLFPYELTNMAWIFLWTR